MKQKKYDKSTMLKVGITGGIGSGKTTVCKLFEALGVAVYYADDRAKFLMQHEHFLIDQLKQNFGEDIYDHGQLNRAMLAQKVFGNKEQLALLNSLVHPVVFRDTERWYQEQLTAKPPYVLKEAALLVETGAYKLLDQLIVVSAPLDVRLQLVVARDKVAAAEVTQRMNNQLAEEEKLKLADFVIENNSDLEALKIQVEKIHQALIEQAKRKHE
jgi:dephospho-CoA kinase